MGRRAFPCHGRRLRAPSTFLAPGLILVLGEGSEDLGTWSCHDYGPGQGTDWCQSIGTADGFEFRYFGADSPCGACWCCKRPLEADEPASDELCPEDMPPDWRERCLSGDLMFARDFGEDDLMPEVGNGHLATVVMSKTIYASGVFNGDAHGGNGASSHRARIPHFNVWVKTSFFDLVAPGCGRALDLGRAVFMQRFKSPEGAEAVEVEENFFAPFQAPRLLVHQISLRNEGDDDQTVTLGSDPSEPSDDFDLEEKQAVLDGGEGALLTTGSTKVGEADAEEFTSLAVARNLVPEMVVVPAKGTTTVYQLTVVVTSLNSTDPTADALDELGGYVAGGFRRAASLLEEHSEIWKRRSERGRIEVEGDLALARAVNASLYFIRSSIREDWPHGLSPGGLASDGYSGHTFWDQELWMWPPLLVLEPSAARSLLQYRADRMDAARAKAKACGLSDTESACQPGYNEALPEEALMFPWESAHTGVDVQFWGGELGPWGRYEQHITGDVAWATRQYWYATKDREWLRQVGFPIANGTASFYSARLQERPGGSEGLMFDLSDVMGPDEYSYPVSNSAYSNAVAKISLEFAAEAAGELGYEGDVYAAFRATSADVPIFIDQGVPDRPDLQGGYHPEYEGFPKDSKKLAKQADAILLSYPLEIDADDHTVVQNDLDFYEHVTDPQGPAMTWSMFAIGWITVGDFERSGAHFRRGYANMQPPFGVWSEVPKGEGYPGCTNFITGAGGFLQSLVFGTSGMRIRSDHLFFNPAPPSATGTAAEKLVLHSFHYLGSRLRQEVTADAVRYELLEASADGPPLCLVAQGAMERPLKVAKAVGLSRSSSAEVRPCSGEWATTATKVRRRLDAQTANDILAGIFV